MSELRKRERSPLILLDPSDNVLVCRFPIKAGDRLVIDDRTVMARNAIDVGHKAARRDLAPGDPVLKYGAEIGVMTEAAPAGGHVHTHNMKSNYIASHTRKSVSEGNER